VLQLIAWCLLGSGGAMQKVDGASGPRRLSEDHLRQDVRRGDHLRAACGRPVVPTALRSASLSRSDIGRSCNREEPRVPRLGSPQEDSEILLLLS
jgi:hypothetical protein